MVCLIQKREKYFGSILLSLLILIGIGCKESKAKKEVVNEKPVVVEELPPPLPPAFVEAHGLVNVQDLNPKIYVDLKYATADNFMGEVLYDSLVQAYLQAPVAKRLSKAQKKLSKIDTSLHLLVYDAVRPRSVQWKMWRGLDTIPVVERVKFVSNPKNASLHNLGCAVDVTICNSDGIPLDMGAGYDDMRKIAYPSLERDFVKKGLLTPEQLHNRQLLRKVMRSQRFFNIPTEWWHFNAYTRKAAKARFEVIE